jgi:hypothetical protein
MWTNVFFRDTAHGFVTWAFATVMTASVLAGASTHIIAAASAGAIPAAGAGASQVVSNTGDVYVDRLMRSGTQTGGQTGASPPDQAATRAELLRLIAPVTRKGGEVTTEDRAYAARLIAARTGIPQAEAEQRVNQTITQAKDAADKARRAAMKFSIWVAIALLAGALSASLAAVEGGKLRNSRWYEESDTAGTKVVRS